MLTVSLVIFDMDGLMFDTERIAVMAWCAAGERFGVEISPELVLKTVGLDRRRTEGVYRAHLGGAFPYQEARAFRIEYANRFIEAQGLPVKAGLYALLDFLNETGIATAVATSSERARTEKFLSLAGIRGRFDRIVCGDEVERGKPDPDIFLAAARGLSVDPAECMVLEDSESGLLAAWRAGMMPVLVRDLNNPSAEALSHVFREFASLDEVRDFLKGAQSAGRASE